VRTIWGTGEFGWNETRLTAAALALFSVSVIAQNLILLFVRGYYSAGETKKPLLIGVFSSILTIVLAFILIQLFNNVSIFQIFIEDLLRVSLINGTSVLMLPLAFSIGMIVNAGLLWCSFEFRFKGFSKTLWGTLINSLFASLLGGIFAYLAFQIFDDIFDINTLIGIFSQGFFAGVLGLVIWAIILKLLRSPEIEEVWTTMKSKIWKAKPIVPAQKEL
jgi:putative peptidoglycan lipid II flippase